MSIIWSGITEEGAVVPVQVTAEGKVVSTSATSGDYVKKTGDTMTGALQLPGDPVDALDASTKQYVDSRGGSNVIAFGYIGGALSLSPYCFNINSIRRTGAGIWEVYFETPSPTNNPAILAVSETTGVQAFWTASNALSFTIAQRFISDSQPWDTAAFTFAVYASTQARQVAYTD